MQGQGNISLPLLFDIIDVSLFVIDPKAGLIEAVIPAPFFTRVNSGGNPF